MTLFPASSTGRSRRLIGASAVGAVAAVISLAGAPGAHAANDFLEFSLDGRKFSSSVSGPIFRDGPIYVPGAAADATIWIRNTSGEPAHLTAAAVMVRSDPQLDRQLGLTAKLTSDPAERAALGAQGSCTDISRVWDLAPGEELELGLAVDLSVDAGNDTMNRTADFDVLFLLESKDVAARPACDALSSGSGQPPAGTGQTPAGSDGTSAGSGSNGAATPTGELVALAGTGRGPAAASTAVQPAGLPEGAVAGGLPKGTAPLEQRPAAILPAAVFSTVEPIIRSLPGTLLITMSVIFTAVVVLRIRNRETKKSGNPGTWQPES